MKQPRLLLWSPKLEALLDPALAGRFEVIRAWEADDRDGLLDARGGDVAAVLTTRLDAAAIERMPGLRLIVVPAAGYEHVDVAAAHQRGITVTNAGDVHSPDVADHALALVLAWIHRLPDMQAWVRDGQWRTQGQPERREAMAAHRFGIAGLGSIGSAVAERLAPFGGDIAWWGPHDKHVPWPRKASLAGLAAWSTVLVIAARGDAAGLVDRTIIQAVGPDGLIVNISRGALIDEDAMIDALKRGTLGGAALDVFADEPTSPDRWRDVPNVILTPHVGGASEQAQLRLREVVRHNLSTVLDGGEVVNEIKA